MTELLLFGAGLFAALLLDSLWWRSGIKKYEKGLEAHEHYHFGLELWLAAALAAPFAPPALPAALAGAGLGFIVSEWSQRLEVHRGRVVPGHPWAWGSSHFRSSTAIGVLLAAAVAAAAVIVR